MAAETYPGFLQNETYSAEILRRSIYSPFVQRGASVGSVTGGTIGSGDMAVTYGGTGLTVSVAAGEAIVPGSTSSTQSGYYFRNGAAYTLTPSAANPSNPRIDLICLTVQDSAYSGSSNTPEIQILTGTPTSGATLSNKSGAPSVPTSSLALAYVLIPAAATTITNADISNTVASILNGGGQKASLNADSGWTNPSNGSYSNSWVNGNGGSGVANFGYRLQGNRLMLRGCLTGGSTGTGVLTLPDAPATNLNLPLLGVTTTGVPTSSYPSAMASITTGGSLGIYFTSVSGLAGFEFDGLSFPID